MPLSNSNSCAEARPEDILRPTDGNAVIATGSPFEPINYEGKINLISQCNNVYIFPGVGPGVLVSRAKLFTNNMMMLP
jgi:Malic enzyme